ALVQALHHCSYRTAFQRRLIDQALMQNVLADLALECEAATALAFRVARAFDDAGREPKARGFARIATAIAKYWICKRAPVHIGEALECHGGNGYVEECMMPRLYREAPVNGIWEGSGNVICLDVLRAPESVAALLAELHAARGADRRYERFVERLKGQLAERGGLEARARRLVEDAAIALQASLLLRHAPPAIADAFCASRLDDVPGGAHGLAFGTLPAGLDCRAIIERAMPVES